MTRRTGRVDRAAREAVDAVGVLARYERWLGRQPLAERTRAAYTAQVRGFVSWLAASEHGAAALSEARVRDWAVRDYKRFVQAAPRRWAPSSVNQALAALDNFYRHLGVGGPAVARERLARVAPRALETSEQRALLRAVQACPAPRDRAIATVFFYTVLLHRGAVVGAGRPRRRGCADHRAAGSAAGAFRQGRRLAGGAAEQRLPGRA